MKKKFAPFKKKRDMKVILINEYDKIAPTGLLVADLIKNLNSHPSFYSFCIKGFGTYKPGWFSALRIFNMIYLHLISFFCLLYLRISSLVTCTKLCCIVTTNPPLIQITGSFYCFILKIPVIIWYQDAHPELEACLFEKYHLKILSNILRFIDSLSFKMADSIIVLDGAMKSRLFKYHSFIKRISVIEPWATFENNAKPLRVPKSLVTLNLFYVGNYGKMHDISPLISELKKLPTENQRKYKIVFVNQSKKAEILLKILFNDFLGQVEFWPKMSFHEVKVVADQFDFGIVCLKSEFLGLACPSKTFTYLSLGLPIFYIGSPNSLPHQVCQQGWGIALNKDTFNSTHDNFGPLHENEGKIFPNPRDNCLKLFKIAIKNVFE